MNKNIVNYLVEHGADINKENEDGETPLFRTCYNGHENIFNYLEYGANIKKENNYDQTPLYDACKNENENIIKFLVEHGADINIENIW